MKPEKHIQRIEKELEKLFVEAHVKQADEYIAFTDTVQAVTRLKDALRYSLGNGRGGSECPPRPE